jgi:hypothetical protein
MDSQPLHGVVKTVAWAVLSLLLVSVLYAGYVALMHWEGIGV